VLALRAQPETALDDPALAFVPSPSAGRPAGAVGSSRGRRFCVRKGVGVTLSPFFSERGMDVLYIFRAAEVWGCCRPTSTFSIARLPCNEKGVA
jgi:hypothetical protein